MNRQISFNTGKGQKNINRSTFPAHSFKLQLLMWLLISFAVVLSGFRQNSQKLFFCPPLGAVFYSIRIMYTIFKQRDNSKFK